MAESHEKGAFQADIPANAVEEALRSVERISHGEEASAGQPAAAGEPGVEITPGAEDASAAPGDPAALAARVQLLEAQLDLSQTKARETLERLKDEHDRLLRAAADLENAKKRAARERDEVQKFGNERILKDLLPALDGLDRALAAAPEDDVVAKGVRMVRSTLEQALAKHGVKGFSAMGQPFDPAVHEALMQVPTADAAPGTVVLEHARGFTLNDRLVRPAMVGVAVAPPPAAPPPADGEAGPE
ncbi:GrpE protein [Anaeromyxobacter dehalogenans 2CP-1]|uniref:Protein GrpE n=1 Tax=Anaeromyxobacter dehalogenans (strain ATCC BAA-258 / DSM 21875 / 2CP-1) TaxID=455488 RepID=B8JCT1_ANAD2|nr:nucleotide exchange factor GrpE [Anaeromyxobacter dehalogenans]ACL67801.1 GrpE protein [Anaeromyxobacter dehalogenans 2CP-1]